MENHNSKFITILSWTLMVLSGWGILSSFYTIIWSFFLVDLIDSFFEDDYNTSFWDMALIFLYPLMPIAFFTGAFNLLKRKNWARLVCMALLALVLVYQLYAFVSMIPVFFEYSDSFGDVQNSLDSIFYSTVVFGLVFSLGLCILCGWLIFRLNSTSVKQEFNQKPPIE